MASSPAATPLTWVKTEIDFSLGVVRESIAAFQQDPAQGSALRLCPPQLHQVAGALGMVQLQGARQFCETLQRAFEAATADPAVIRGLATIDRSVLALKEFVDGVADGGDNAPLRLYPVYRELAAMQGRTDTSEKELFYPEVTLAPPPHASRVTIAADAIPEYAQAQRTRFQRGLVAWMHKPHDARGLREMLQAVDAMDQISAQLPGPQALWWIAAAVIEGLMQPPSPQWLVGVRPMCSKIDFEMRNIAKQTVKPNEQLVRDLLYAIATCVPPSDRVKAVRSRFRLDELLPEPDVGLDFDMEWVQPAIADFRTRLETAKAAWLEYLGGEPHTLARFRDLVKALKARADELGSHQLVRLFDVIALVSGRLPDPYPPDGQALMLEMPTAFLLAESVLDGFNRPPPDLEQQVVLINGWLLDAVSGKAGGLPPQGLRPDLVQQYNATQLRTQVAKEILHNLQQAEQILDAYSRNPADRSALQGVHPNLHQVHGAFALLGLAPGLEVLARVGDMVTGIDAENPNRHDIDWIAEGISSLGMYLEPCVRGRAPDAVALERFLAHLAQRPHPPAVPQESAAAIPESAQAATPSETRAPDVAPRIEAPLDMEESHAAQAAPAEVTTAPAPASGVAPETQAASAAGIPEGVNEELLEIYLEEAREVLSNIAAALPRCEARADDREALTAIRRGFHTLKGSGRMVGLNDLGEVAWAIEQAMNRWLEADKPATPALLDLIRKASARFSGWLRSLQAREPLVLDADAVVVLAKRLQTAEAVVAEQPLITPHAAPEHPAAAIEPAHVREPEQPVLETMPAAEPSIAPVPPPTEAPAPEAPLSSLDFDLSEPAPEADTGSASDAKPAEDVTIGTACMSPALYDIYVKEAQAHTVTLEHEFGAWGSHPEHQASREFHRAAHTLAGISRTAGIDALAELASALEHWLPAAPQSVSTDDQQLVREVIRTLTDMVAAVARYEAPGAASELAAALHALIARAAVERPPAAAEPFSVAVEPAPVEPLPVAVEALAAVVEPAPAAIASAASEAQIIRAVAATRAEQRVIRDDIDPQLLPIFLDEAHELLPQIGADLREWRAKPHETKVLQSLKRTLHTLKGSARMAGAMRLGELTHLMESRVEAAQARGQPGVDTITELESQMDRLSAGIEGLRQAGAIAPVPTQAGAQPATAAAAERPTAAVSAAPAAILRINADTLDRLINQAGEASIARARIEGEMRALSGSAADLNESVGRLRAQLRELEIQADSQTQSRLSTTGGARTDFDPLEFDRYTRLQELTRMMAETIHDALAIQQNVAQALDKTDAALVHQSRIQRDLQQDLMRLRTVPFASIVERLHRVVRISARELGKKANLEIRGEQVEVDRSVLDRVGAPLEHLLRNAVAHGIEAPAERVTRGKAETGEVSVTLRQESDDVVIVVADDGAGLDLQKLRRKAVEKGLLPADHEPDEREISRVIFAPGLSTADEVTELSGRGIGMDVVRNEIAAVGGRIEIETTPGGGTTFTIYLPLTLAVAQAVLVRSGNELYAVSSALVSRVLRVKPEAVAELYERGAAHVEGQSYPLHYLGSLTGSSQPAPAEGYTPVLLLRSGNQRIAMHVDELLKNDEIVIKNIGPQLARLPWITGATVLGDGRIVLLINPVQLAQQPRLAPQPPTAEPSTATPAEHTVMVVDDSLTVRKITTRLLEREGYRVLAAKDGVDALEQLHHALPDVMLVDIEMPRMDGFDLTRNVRGDPKTAATPIIVISSRTADKHRSHAIELGVDAFIGKPYEEAELLSQIKRCLTKAPQHVH